MSSKKQSTEMERVVSTTAAAKLLESIAEGLRSRELVVQGETPLTLFLPGNVEIKLEAKSKPKKGTLSLKLQWQPPLLAGPGLQVGNGPRISLGAEPARLQIGGSPPVAEGDEDEADDGPATAPRPRRVVTAKAPVKKKAAPRKRGAAKKRTTK